MQFSRLAKPLGFLVIALLPTSSNLLLTLVLVRGLGIDGFATWSIIEPLLLIFGAISALGMHQGLLFATASSAADPGKALGHAMTVAFPMSIVFATIVWLLAHRMIGSVGYFSLLLPLTAETLSMLIIASLRGQRRMGAWIAFEATRALGLVSVALLALWLDWSWVRMIDQFLILRGVFTGTAVVAIALWVKAEFGWDRALVVRMMRYGLPIAGAALVGMVTVSMDRLLLASFQSDSATIASYVAHQRLTGILGVLTVTPLNLWFAVEAMRRDTSEHVSFFQGVVVVLLVALATLMLAAFIGGPLIWPYLFPGIAFDPFIFAILALAVVPQSLGIVLNIGGLREKKTHLNAIVVACSSLTMLVVGIPLVIYAAATGVALARFASFLANAWAGRMISQWIAPVDHHIVPLLPVAAAFVTAIASLFHNELGMPFWLFPIATAALVVLTLFREAVRIRELIGAPPSARIEPGEVGTTDVEQAPSA